MQYTDVLEIIDVYSEMKGGKPKKKRQALQSDFPPPPPFASEQEKQAYSIAMAKEVSTAKREKRALSMESLEVQRTFAMRNRPVGEVFDELTRNKKKKK